VISHHFAQKNPVRIIGGAIARSIGCQKSGYHIPGVGKKAGSGITFAGNDRHGAR